MAVSPKIVDNTDPNVIFYINPQYVNVTDIISDKAYAYVQAAIPSTSNKSVADITVPKWSFEYQFTGEYSGVPALSRQPCRKTQKVQSVSTSML